MNDLPADYELNEADIEKMIRHLKLAYPEDTITPEMAIEALEEMYKDFHQLAHSNPELLEKWYKQTKDSDSKKESDRSV